MSFFSFARRAIGALPDIAWFGKLGADLIGATFSGHDAGKDSHVAVKGISGMFGFKDERQMLVLFEKLLKELEERQTGTNSVVSKFLDDHFGVDKPGLTFAAKRYIKIQRSRFRAVVVDMGETEGGGEKYGKRTSTIDGKTAEGHTYKVVSEEDLLKKTQNNALDLLLRMHTILSMNGKSDEERKALCLQYLKSAVVNVPLVDPEMVNQLNNAQETTIRKMGEVVPQITNLAREGGRLTNGNLAGYARSLREKNRLRRQNQPWWHRLINKLK